MANRASHRGRAVSDSDFIKDTKDTGKHEICTY